VLTFDRQSGVYPVLLASLVVPYVLVSHVRQFTGGLLRSRSLRTPAVDHHVCALIW
jgi:hypothetical protein